MNEYKNAQALCSGRLGPPSEESLGDKPKTVPLTRWWWGNHEVMLTHLPGMAVILVLDLCGEPEQAWTVDGEPTEEAPYLPITEALAKVMDQLKTRPNV